MNHEVILTLLELKGVGPGTVNRIASKAAGAVIPDYDFLNTELKGKLPSETTWSRLVEISSERISSWADAGIIVSTIGDDLYPAALTNVKFAPSMLFMRGDIGRLRHPSLGVIGTRNPTRIGTKAAERIGLYFSSNGFSIVNGLADGVDWIASGSSPTSLANTIAVAGCGLDFDKSKLSTINFKQRACSVIEAGGLVVSDYQPGVAEDQYRIISSCKLQAALSIGMIMVQSSIGGGTRFTVESFIKTHRDFHFLVPPSSELESDQFSANLMLATQGKNFLKEFIGIEASKVESDLHPISSSSDYPSITDRVMKAHRNLHKSSRTDIQSNILF